MIDTDELRRKTSSVDIVETASAYLRGAPTHTECKIRTT